MTQIYIGLAIIIICAFGYPIFQWFKSLYYMIDCLLHGGDWRYYRDNVLIGLMLAGLVIGFCLVGYGMQGQIER